MSWDYNDLKSFLKINSDVKTKIPKLIKLKQSYLNQCLNNGTITNMTINSSEGVFESNFGCGDILHGIPTVVDDTIEEDYEIVY